MGGDNSTAEDVASITDKHVCKMDFGPTNVSLVFPDTFVPFCDSVPVGIKSGFGVLCWPFWEFSAAEVLVLFFFLFFWRIWGRREIFKWKVSKEYLRQERERKPKKEEDLMERGTGAREPFLGIPRKNAGDELKHTTSGVQRSVIQTASEVSLSKPQSCCFQWTVWLIKKGCDCTVETVKRIILQVFQWWLVMLCILTACLLLEFISLRDVHGVETGRNEHGKWYMRMPEIPGLPSWLATFALYSYAALVLVYCISFFCIVLQVLTHLMRQFVQCKFLFATGSAMVDLPRDVAIQVLLLPMVYGFLAAKSVSCMFSKMSGNFKPALYCWGWDLDKQRAIQNDVYASNFALADMYEAWALFCFGQMVAKVMQPELRKKIRLDVFQAFEDLLLIDVSVFVFICAVGAVFTISLTWCKWRLGLDVCTSWPFVCRLTSYLTGANWCVSSIAIYNLFSIEHKFANLETMKHFNPSLKFWSIKLMVLVAFWASLVMAIIRDVYGLTEDQGMLLDASFRVYVMLVVSVMNLRAWWPWSRWYKAVQRAETDIVKNNMLFGRKNTDDGKCIGEKSVPPGTISLMKRLFPEITDEEAAKEKSVESYVKGLTEDGMHRVLHLGSQIGWCLPVEDSSMKKSRNAMIDMTHKERQQALQLHLESFYPEY